MCLNFALILTCKSNIHELSHVSDQLVLLEPGNQTALVKKRLFTDTLDQAEPGDKDSRTESRGKFTDLWRHDALSGSDVGHGLVVALLVVFPVAWMTMVVVVVGGLLASHANL